MVEEGSGVGWRVQKRSTPCYEHSVQEFILVNLAGTLASNPGQVPYCQSHGHSPNDTNIVVEHSLLPKIQHISTSFALHYLPLPPHTVISHPFFLGLSGCESCMCSAETPAAISADRPAGEGPQEEGARLEPLRAMGPLRGGSLQGGGRLHCGMSAARVS